MTTRIVCQALSARSQHSRFSSKFVMPNLNSTHFKEGDAQPALQKGLLRLYNMRFCPYAQRAVLVLDAKNVPYDVVNCNLMTKPEWLFKKSDGGKVPALEFEDGTVLSESLIISDFLDDAYPNPPLYPKDPLAKAQDRLLIEKFNGVTSAFFSVLLSPEDREKKFNTVVEKLAIFETELEKRGTKFFAGSAPGMLDLMIWPWIERGPLFELKFGSTFQLPESKLTKLSAWRNSMLATDFVKKSALPPAVHKKYLDNRKDGIYDFDYGSHL